MAIKIPAFTTTCDYETEMDSGTWYIYLKSSGSFAFKYAKTKVDIFLQGGGGGGAGSGDYESGGGGGAGGYQSTQYNQSVDSGSYAIEVGDGGEAMKTGGKTSAFGFTALGGGYGGDAGNFRVGSRNGTGAGGTGGYYNDGMNLGERGYDGEDGLLAFGRGSVYYGAGGGGSASKFASPHGAGGKTGGGNGGSGNGAANTGSGGGGDNGKGGSGIVILRGTQDDQLPVKFDGMTLQSILYNGEEVVHLIHDGTQIFMERMRMVIGWLKQKRPLLQPAG